jgi:gliding motility-associated-like protein
VNDVFIIQLNEGAEGISVSGEIFDRWGNLVFSSQELPFAWDGAFNGQMMNPGVYIYMITLVYSNGLSLVTENLTGDVTVVR